jgi:hypothetical protein
MDFRLRQWEIASQFKLLQRRMSQLRQDGVMAVPSIVAQSQSFQSRQMHG